MAEPTPPFAPVTSTVSPGGLDPGRAVDGLVRRHVVQDERRRLRVVDPRGHRDELARADDDPLGVPPVDDQRGSPLADAEARDGSADFHHLADHLVPRDEGQRRREDVASAAHGEVRAAHAARAHAQPHLARAKVRVGSSTVFRVSGSPFFVSSTAR